MTALQFSFPHQKPPLPSPPWKCSGNIIWQTFPQSLRSVDWDTILTPNIDTTWSIFFNIFHFYHHNFTPCQAICSSFFSLWFSHSLIRKIHKRRHLYHQAITSQNPHTWSQYRTLRNSIGCDIQKAKASYYLSLSTSTHSVWLCVRSVRKFKSSIPTLTTSNFTCSTDRSKANLLSRLLNRLSRFADFLPEIAHPLLLNLLTVFPMTHHLGLMTSPLSKHPQQFPILSLCYSISLQLLVPFPVPGKPW